MAELLSMETKRNNEKQKALDSALAQIERQFGKGSIMKLGAVTIQCKKLKLRLQVL